MLVSVVKFVQWEAEIEIAKRYGMAWKSGDHEKTGIMSPDFRGQDIFDRLDVSALLAIRRVFHKRHVCQHAGGVITEKYIRKVPEDVRLLGTEAKLSLEEFDLAAQSLRVILDNLVSAVQKKKK